MSETAQAIHGEVSLSVLKAGIRDGILKAHPECEGYTQEVEIDTILGKMRIKTRAASPDAVTTVYLNGHRLYKIMVDCCQSRDRLEMIKMVEQKLDRESFVTQARKVLAYPITA